ncbi:DUF998 domain-containing protein [Streptomyces sp. Je 1-79]|uniref:DUF998 domain-containing protein n=1 Tax=Streptomyces sp. Je 1-79 TaxID=2943847 RepID=UPI0021A2B768|nr:DUF998 domain-containing protein [Streptomyces sp. Je 1-79]MCT4352990.1 DUF998 domain-containing protein [Streptomyces sp. Je 1-79]
MSPSLPGSAARVTAALLALGALAYSAWVLEAVVRTGLDPVRTYVSELAATDQPFGGFFRAADLTAGLLVLAAATTALWATRRDTHDATGPGEARPEAGSAAGPGTAGSGSRMRRPSTGSAAGPGTAGSGARRTRRLVLLGWVALAVFGAATALDSRLPLSCSPTVDPECAAREAAGLVPATHTAHVVSSGLAMTAALAAMVVLTLAARRYGIPRLLGRTGSVLVVLELAATAWTLAAVAASETGGGNWALGAGQRLQVLLVAVWLAVLAVSVARERT